MEENNLLGRDKELSEQPAKQREREIRHKSESQLERGR